MFTFFLIYLKHNHHPVHHSWRTRPDDVYEGKKIYVQNSRAYPEGFYRSKVQDWVFSLTEES